jgi:hypothetical protein
MNNAAQNNNPTRNNYRSDTPSVSAIFAMVDAPPTPQVDTPKRKTQVSSAPSATSLLALADAPPASAPKVDTPKPVTPPPAPKPKPVVYASWAKLPGGQWGVRAGVDHQVGDWVTVQKRDGSTTRVKLGGKSHKVGVFYNGCKRQAKRAPQRQCPGNNYCRTRGWPKGPRCSYGP